MLQHSTAAGRRGGAARAAAPAQQAAPRAARHRPPSVQRRPPPRVQDDAPIPWSPLHARVLSDVRQRSLLPRGVHVLVAVSGGQDSMCLAQLLLDLAPLLQITLAIAHCDHAMRPDSAAAAAHVRGWAAARGLPYYHVAASRPLHSEAAAREWRYQQLICLAAEARASHVATGHTASDQAETLLLNIARGCGLEALTGMRWSRPLAAADGASSSGGGGGGSGSSDVMLVRPLLGMRREETAEECLRQRLQVWEDATNSDTRLRRNLVRARLLPLLGEVNAGAVGHAAALAEQLRGDADCLQQASAALLLRAEQQHAARQQGGSSLPGVDRVVLLSAHPALRQRALHVWLQQHGGGGAAARRCVEQACLLVDAGPGARSSTLPGGACLEVRGPSLVLVFA